MNHSAADVELFERIARGELEAVRSRLVAELRRRNPATIGLLGSMRQFGIGLRRNDQVALLLLRRAARLGDALAAHNLSTHLAVAYRDVPGAIAEARRWALESARLGFPIACPDLYEDRSA